MIHKTSRHIVDEYFHKILIIELVLRVKTVEKIGLENASRNSIKRRWLYEAMTPQNIFEKLKCFRVLQAKYLHIPIFY